MNNIGIEINLNGNVIKRAGIDGDLFSITCIISSAKRGKNIDGELVLNLGGLNVETDEYISWINSELEYSDELIVKFIRKNFDKPVDVRKRTPKSKEEILAAKIEQFEKLKIEIEKELNSNSNN